MVDLVLTDEESAKAWCDLSDADIAAVARFFLVKTGEYTKSDGGFSAMRGAAGVLGLMSFCIETNAETFDLTLDGVTLKGVPVGDWTIHFSLEKKTEQETGTLATG
jgi:hypothetical protein